MHHLLAVTLALAPSLAVAATVPVDDFESVTDWSGLAAEASTVHQGAGAGRWSDHVTKTAARKAFATPLDVSSAHNLDFWCWSAVANGAGIELVLDSENGASSGADYYSVHLVVDWTGWRRIRLPLSKFGVARQPLGWNQIKAITFNASGWSNTPKADTALVFDDMAFDGGPVLSWDGSFGWGGADYTYSWPVLLTNGGTSSRTLTLGLDAGAGFATSLDQNPVTLAAGASATVTASVTIPASYLTPAHAMESRLAAFTVQEGGKAVDEQALRVVVPFARRPHPRTLLDGADFTRMAQWAGSEAWAKSARDGIVASAADWPAGFQAKYGVSAWSVPTEGGQWGLWYVCPVHGVRLKYTPPMTHTCPVDSKLYTGWPYDQVVYAWMHDDLAAKARVLAMAWRFDQDSAKAASAVAILKQYADRYSSFPIHDVDGNATTSGARVLAQTLDESGWAINLAWAYDLVGDYPGLSDADRTHIEQDLLVAAAKVIDRNHAGKGNWQSWHNAALTAVGFAVDDPLWQWQALRSPTDGFELQMAQSIPSDGIWYEGSWGYHFYALDALEKTAHVFTRAGIDLFARPELRSMFEAPLDFAQPDLTLPSFNDDGGSSLTGNASDFEVAYARYGAGEFASPLAGRTRGQDALMFGAQALPASPPLPSASKLYPESGYAVLRTGTGLDQTYLALDFGPHGGWHGHFDKLGFVLYGRGGVMALDPGTQSYAAPTHATWDKVSLAHNTVTLDEKSQGEATGALHRLVTLPGSSMVAADSGGALVGAKGLRTMVATGDYVLDRFAVVAADGAPHQIDWAFHDYGALTTSLTTSATPPLPATDGYQHLSNARSAQTGSDWSARFQLSDATPRAYGSVWASDASATGTFTQTTEQAAAGSWSGKLGYSFTVAGKYVLYTTKALAPIGEVPSTIKLQVWGDGSGDRLSVRLMDATDERFVKVVGPVDWNGWKTVELTDVEGSWSHYLGDADGVFDTPAKSLVLQIDGTSAGSGALYVDDLHLVYPSAGDVLAEGFELPGPRDGGADAGRGGDDGGDRQRAGAEPARAGADVARAAPGAADGLRGQL
ncbi:MAG: alginate lyase family protein [Myxococcales bacterium]